MSGPRGSSLRHLGGLALAGGLLVLCWAVWLWVPGWIRGTPVQDLGLLITFIGWIAVLTAAERLSNWWAAKAGTKGH